MKIFRWQVNLQKAPKPLPAELVTALALLEHSEERLAQMEENVKLTRSRLETVYRKVYRDEESLVKGNGKDTEELLKAFKPPAREIKAGDSPG